MKSILVIGIGRFGQHVSKKFAELGNDVIAIDISEERISEVAPYILSAQIGDCTRENTLKELGVRNFDICVVTLSNIGPAMEITYLLKELGAPYVITRAGKEMHMKLLLKSGADEVVYPEKNIAERIAVKYNSDGIFDFIEITSDYSIWEMDPPKAWIGKSIQTINVRAVYNINILAYKSNHHLKVVDSNYIFKKNEHLIVFGSNKNASKVIR